MIDILLTNDDGYNSVGFYPLLKSISARSTLSIQNIKIGEFEGHSVSGTPADCVQIGLKKLSKKYSVCVVAPAEEKSWVGYEPRVKPTSDELWISSHGTEQVDIANTAYPDLPEDWQAENKAAAEVVVGLLDEAQGTVDVRDPAQRSYVGGKVHDAWLARNAWAKGGELNVPFDQLPKAEQAKDIDQVVIAQSVLSLI